MGQFASKAASSAVVRKYPKARRVALNANEATHESSTTQSTTATTTTNTAATDNDDKQHLSFIVANFNRLNPIITTTTPPPPPPPTTTTSSSSSSPSSASANINVNNLSTLNPSNQMLDIVNKRREIQQQQQQHSSSLEVRRVNTSTTTTHTTPHSSSNSIPTPLLVQLFALRRQFTYLKSINEIQPSNTLLLDHLHSRFPSLSRDSISVLLSTYNTPETDIEGGGSGSAKMVWVEDLLEWRRSNNGKKSE